MGPDSIATDAGAKDKNAVNVNRMHAAIVREQQEPEDGFEALPTPWLLCMLGLALICGWYFGAYTADFSATRLDGEVIADASGQNTQTQAPLALDPKIVGKRIYTNCMACHQADGSGVVGQFPPLAQSEWVLGDPDALARILLHGLQGGLEVLGQHYDGVMPAWQRLSDEDIAAVLTYIRGAFGNTASAVEPALIAKRRQEDGPTQRSWTQIELRQLGVAP